MTTPHPVACPPSVGEILDGANVLVRSLVRRWRWEHLQSVSRLTSHEMDRDPTTDPPDLCRNPLLGMRSGVHRRRAPATPTDPAAPKSIAEGLDDLLWCGATSKPDIAAFVVSSGEALKSRSSGLHLRTCPHVAVVEEVSIIAAGARVEPTEIHGLLHEGSRASPHQPRGGLERKGLLEPDKESANRARFGACYHDVPAADTTIVRVIAEVGIPFQSHHMSSGHDVPEGPGLFAVGPDRQIKRSQPCVETSA